MKSIKQCPCCYAKMVEYKHSFSKAQAVGLGRLFNVGKPINIRLLDLTRNQWTNFQKLRYWGFVEKAKDDEGNRVGGVWQITAEGKAFVKGIVPTRKSVWTYRGKTVRTEGEFISFRDIHPGDYKQQGDYAREAEPHGEDGQLQLNLQEEVV